MKQKTSNRPKIRKWLWISSGAILFFAIIRVAFIILINKPLAPSLPATAQAVATNSTGKTGNPAVASTPGTGSTTTAQPGICGEGGVWTILAIGQDYRGEGDEYLYGLADVIRLIRVDFTNSKISVLAIPRDLWVHIPDLADQKIDFGKINQAYFFGTPGMGHFTGTGGGAGLLAETLKFNFGIYPDHYVVVSMNAFVHIIDAVGGIDLTLTQAVDGNVKFAMGYYPAGNYHFNGSEALMFSRIRYGYTELKRIDNESIILNALFDKINSPEVKVNLLEVAKVFQDENSVRTDLSPANLATLVCAAGKIDKGNIKMATLPKDSFTGQMIFSSIQNDDTFAYIPNTAKVQQAIDQFKTGIWP